MIESKSNDEKIENNKNKSNVNEDIETKSNTSQVNKNLVEEDEQQQQLKMYYPNKPVIGDIFELEDEDHQRQDYILKGYRINFNSFGRILKSVFMIHNETVNIWSHFLGAISIIFLIIYTAIYIVNNLKLIKNFNIKEFENRSQNTYITQSIEPILAYLKDLVNLYMKGVIEQAVYIDKMIYYFSLYIQKNILCLSCSENITLYIKDLLDSLIQRKSSQSSIDFLSYKEDIYKNMTLIVHKYYETDIQLIVIEKWPLFIMLICGIICLILSSIFHLFIPHSKNISNLFNRLDYAGIAILIIGSCYPPNFYIFYCEFRK